MSKVVLINPGNRKQVFQNLGQNAAAIEPPFWIAVIAAFLREKGHQIVIIDANAENLLPEETAARACAFDPLLCAVIVYGSQPSASTQNMPSAGAICKALRKAGRPNLLMAGLHPSALPETTMREEPCDFVAEGEGILTLEALLEQLTLEKPDFASVGGLWWRQNNQILHIERLDVIQDLDRYLPVAAWDLLPMSLYRAHDWHCFDNLQQRQPYGAIYTSLGCPFHCDFCCINAPFGKPGIRYRSPERVLAEIDLLVSKYQIRNLKIVDELFILNKAHYLPIVKGLIERNYQLNIWVYARLDTIDFDLLPLLKKAGINWFALGIESANAKIRDDVHKNMHQDNIREIVRKIQAAGIHVIGNFIFGLPSDTLNTMQETLDLALQLNCEFANFYSVMAYPGSQLYRKAAEETPELLPESWSGFSQHSFDCKPLANACLTAAQILQFRDHAFHRFYSNPDYLNGIEKQFGKTVRNHIQQNNSNILPRKLFS